MHTTISLRSSLIAVAGKAHHHAFNVAIPRSHSAQLSTAFRRQYTYSAGWRCSPTSTLSLTIGNGNCSVINTVQYNTTKQQYTPHDHRHPYITQSSSSSSSSRRNFSAISPKRPQVSNPFRTLKIPKDAKYSHAKKSFLKIAMKHHPDTVSTECEITQKKSQEIFMKCRAALESLVECEDTGLCLLRSEVEELEDRSMSDEEFDSWFEEETGHQNPFSFDLDPAVMREVASMHDDMAGSHGLDRDGGMWHLASLISSAVKKGKDGAESVLKLEAGSIREGENVEAKGKLERRRKRVRGRR